MNNNPADVYERAIKRSTEYGNPVHEELSTWLEDLTVRVQRAKFEVDHDAVHTGRRMAELMGFLHGLTQQAWYDYYYR